MRIRNTANFKVDSIHISPTSTLERERTNGHTWCSDASETQHYWHMRNFLWQVPSTIADYAVQIKNKEILLCYY